MRLRDELAECPATFGLAASWVAVFLVMHATQSVAGLGARGGAGHGAGVMGLGLLRPETIRLFGAITWRDFAGGEPWRAVTATFIHVNLPHLVMNLIGLVNLGRLIEPWYGGRQFLALCLALGGLGNGLGVTMRHGLELGRAWVGARGLGRVLPAFLTEGAPGMMENTPAAGGSTVILGLIGLAMVVGWRSRTRVGAFLRDQMVGFLAFTAILGFLGRQFIDNFGHLGGAMAGAAAGFLHRRVVRSADRRAWPRAAGVVVAIGLVACVALQLVAARADWASLRRGERVREAQARVEEADGLIQRLDLMGVLVEQVATEHFVVETARAALLGDPARVAGLDPSPPFVDPGRVVPPVSTPDGQRVPTVAVLRALANDLASSRSRLEPGLTGDDLDEVIATGLAPPGDLDSARLSRFRLARALMAKRARAVRAEWLALRDRSGAAARR